MKWITAGDLKQWAERIGARTDFPALIRDLIISSTSDISEIRFPAGDVGQVRGFDGVLEAADASTYVPAKKSIWEFGVSANPQTKFHSDYTKRVEEIDASERANLTFVFATPRTWDNPKIKLQDWLGKYIKKNDFADVRYIDGTQLEDWLEQQAAVGAKHARTVLGRVPQTGARSTDEFWNEYSNRFQPKLTEEVVLCARGLQAEQIVTHLMGKPGSLVFVGDGPDEVSAVSVAAIRQSESDRREFLEARTLIVDSDDAGRELGIADRYGYIVSPSAHKVSGYLAGFGPTVGGMGFRPPSQRFDRLERPSTRDMSEALLTMGLTNDEASSLSVKSGRILTILERHAPAGAFESPSWAEDGETLIPALLAGGWDSRNDGDKEVIAELGHGKYHEVETKLRKFLDQHDSPLDREAGIWKLRAPVDGFVNLSSQLGEEHLSLLASVAIRVFSTEDSPSINEERFGVSKAPYSSWLREGLANTLLMLATLCEETNLDVGQDPVEYVNDLVASLPGLRDNYRMILSLERQLPVLMEASPDPLLSALEHILEGEPSKISAIFTESTVFGAPHNNLPSLLWALEMLAWDPKHLMRVSLLLASMADIDPGGKSGNRPINSLRDIFVAWSPGTNATLSMRLSVIDEISSRYVDTGWRLLSQLLPQMHDSKSSNQRPRFREAGASNREVLTHGIVRETYDAITDRVLSLVDEVPDRWNTVLESFTRFTPERRLQFLDMLERRTLNISVEEKKDFRQILKRLADRHKRFRDADWSLPDTELDRLSILIETLESSDPIDQVRELFDDWLPMRGTDYEVAQKQVEQRRQQAVEKIAQINGSASILKLVESVKMPQLVAAAVAKGIPDKNIIRELLDHGVKTEATSEFASSLAGSLRWDIGEQFNKKFQEMASEMGWSNNAIADLMLGWPEGPTTWSLVDSLGGEAKQNFWRKRRSWRFEGKTEELEQLVSYFVAADRPGSAMEVIHGREDELDWSTISDLLGRRIEQINTSGFQNDLDGYYVEELFKQLRARNDVPRTELARWEYSYFPLLEYRDAELVIFDLMANDPEFYVSILSDVFVEDGTNPDEQETTEEERARGSASHSILIAFERTPGQIDGVVQQDSLNTWVDGMIAEATKVRRLNIVYSYIGRALAHSSEHDNLWPQRPVAEVIERLKCNELEHGIIIERFNMRGVYSKDMFEGGREERDLAQRYREWANQTAAAHVRTKAMLNTIAEQWDKDAKQADEEAARDKLRFE